MGIWQETYILRGPKGVELQKRSRNLQKQTKDTKTGSRSKGNGTWLLTIGHRLFAPSAPHTPTRVHSGQSDPCSSRRFDHVLSNRGSGGGAVPAIRRVQSPGNKKAVPKPPNIAGNPVKIQSPGNMSNSPPMVGMTFSEGCALG